MEGVGGEKSRGVYGGKDFPITEPMGFTPKSISLDTYWCIRALGFARACSVASTQYLTVVLYSMSRSKHMN